MTKNETTKAALIEAAETYGINEENLCITGAKTSTSTRFEVAYREAGADRPVFGMSVDVTLYASFYNDEDGKAKVNVGTVGPQDTATMRLRAALTLLASDIADALTDGTTFIAVAKMLGRKVLVDGDVETLV